MIPIKKFNKVKHSSKTSFEKTKKFTLRKATMKDAQSIAKYANNKKIADNLTTLPSPYSLKDAREYIKRCQKRYKQKEPDSFNLGIEINKEIVGMIGVHEIKHEHKAEIGYWLGEPFWGKGIMSRAVKLSAKECVRRFKLKRLEAHVFSYNKASARVLEKNGFKYEGLLKKYHKKGSKYIDAYIYALVK